MSKPKCTPDFGFEFADGFKWSEEMSRDELLIVIQTLLIEREYAKKDLRDALVLSKNVVLT